MSNTHDSPVMSTAHEIHELRKSLGSLEGMAESLRSIGKHMLRTSQLAQDDYSISALSDGRTRRRNLGESLGARSEGETALAKHDRQLRESAMRLVESMLAEGEIVITSDPYAGGRLIFKKAK